MLIDEGEKIVADARIFVSGGLHVNQSILTGESVAQEKNISFFFVKFSSPGAAGSGLEPRGRVKVAGIFTIFSRWALFLP